MPVWVPRDLSEIKPGSFKQSLHIPSTDSPGCTDPNYRFVKRLLHPRERDPELTRLMTGEDYVPRRHKEREPATAHVSAAMGQALIKDFLGCQDLDELRRDLRSAARREHEEMRSGIKPASAHKLYAWRDLLEEREPLSGRYTTQPVPSSVYLPDPSSRLISIYHRDTAERGKLHHTNGYWQINQPGPQIYRDKWGLKILNNLEPEREVERRTLVEEKDYHYQWPLTDPDTGHSVEIFVKKD